MKNRIPTYAGRVKLIPVDGEENTFDMVRADEPIDEGTPLNKRLLDFAVAANGVTAGTNTAYTLDDEFGGFVLSDGARINFKLHVSSGDSPTINVNNTGAKPLTVTPTIPMTPGTSAGTWYTAIYNAESDCFILSGNEPVVKLLWENNNEDTNSFSAQTIELGATGYRKFLIIFKALISKAAYSYRSVGYAVAGAGWEAVQCVTNRSNGILATYTRRYAVPADGKSIRFEACRRFEIVVVSSNTVHADEYTTDTSNLIPMEIYGIG